MLTITSEAFCIEGMGTNSYRPWKLSPPAKMLGQGSPLNESWAPSVPPRMGYTLGSTPLSRMACSAVWMMSMMGSIFSRML